ncbi:MAG: RDD family protein [candidate division WWE3 bacterium]|nr:RDD family protein [candidate division WWE3 bacterium]
MIKATFWERLLARIIDALLFGLINMGAFYLVFLNQPNLVKLLTSSLTIFGIVILNDIGLVLVYRVLFTHFFGGTLGKLLVGIEICDIDNKHLSLATSLLRYTVGYVLSAALFCLGFFWTLRKERLAWHDLLVGSSVVRKRPLWPLGILVVLVLLVTNVGGWYGSYQSLVNNQVLRDDLGKLVLKIESTFPGKNQTPQSPWLTNLIASEAAAPVANPPAALLKCLYNGQTVIYQPAHCCDVPSRVYDFNGKMICSPDGGFTGQGDGKCSNFNMLKQNCEVIWRDSRT